jgi:hypothetical protein
VSRGLGPTQQTILEALREGGRPGELSRLVRCVHYGPEDDWPQEWPPEPPRSVLVNVRRAVQGLERRGAVRRGKVRGRYGGRAVTVLWLPDAEPPERLDTEAPSLWREMDAPLLEFLRATTVAEVDAWFWSEGYGIRGYGIPHSYRHEERRRALATWRRAFPTPDDGGGAWVPYQWAVRELVKGLADRYAPPGFYRGLLRVVARLEAHGAVQTRESGTKWSDAAGYYRVRTYHAIRCLAGTRTSQATDTGGVMHCAERTRTHPATDTPARGASGAGP